MAKEKKDPKEVGKSLMEMALAKLPEETRTQFKTIFESPDALHVLGEHGMLRDEASRFMDEATVEKTKFQGLYDQNLKWRDDNIATLNKGNEALSILERMKASGVSLDDNLPDPALAPRKTEDTVDGKKILERIAQSEIQGLGVMVQLANLQGQHQFEFKRPLDTGEIVSIAQKKNLTLEAAYNDYVSEDRKSVADAKYKADIDAAKRAGYEEAMTKASSVPYIVGNSSSSPTTLSGLSKDPAVRAKFGVEAAVAAFNQSRRTSA